MANHNFSIRILIISLLFFINQKVFSLGSIAHNYVARQVFQKLKEVNGIYKILEADNNEYLVGSDYPDTGFTPWATYGEISHWQPFVDAYIQYLHENYKEESYQRQKLLAFLMGICTHIQSDIISHWTYYNWVALYDFKNLPDPNNAWSKAHQAMDPGSDFYVIVNKHIYNHPVIWWVPVKDLVNIYKIMGRDIPEKEIIIANAIYYLATGLDETLVALPAYLYERYVYVPWGMSNWETEDGEKPLGAFPGEINDSVNYLNLVWKQYNDKNTKFDITIKDRRSKSMRPWESPAKEFIANAIRENWIQVNPVVDANGNVVFTNSSFIKTDKYKEEEIKFIQKFKNIQV